MFSRVQLVAFTVAAAVSVCQGYAGQYQYHLSNFPSRVLTHIYPPVLSTRDLPANCARSYTIASGDTCDKISAAQSVSTYAVSDTFSQRTLMIYSLIQFSDCSGQPGCYRRRMRQLVGWRGWSTYSSA